jgi:hypothetical protein
LRYAAFARSRIEKSRCRRLPTGEPVRCEAVSAAATESAVTSRLSRRDSPFAKRPARNALLLATESTLPNSHSRTRAIRRDGSANVESMLTAF